MALNDFNIKGNLIVNGVTIESDGTTINLPSDATVGNQSITEIIYSNTPGFFSVAADDSTERKVNSGEIIQFIGGTGITTTSDAEGNITITGFNGAYSSLTGTPTKVSAFTNDSGYITSETTTTLTSDSINTKLVYTDETGTANDVDLSWAIDDTNLARITSGSVDGGTGIATFSRDDATTFTVDFSALFDDTNLTRITSGSFNSSTGDLTLTRSDATTVPAISLDGRYLTSYTVTESDVTAHEAALSITESQVSDLGSYIENVVDDTTPQLGGDLDMNGKTIDMTGNARIAAFSGDDVVVDSYGAVGNAGNIYLTTYSEGGDRGHVTINYIKYPNSDGTPGQVLTTDGYGNLSFADASGGGGTFADRYVASILFR